MNCMYIRDAFVCSTSLSKQKCVPIKGHTKWGKGLFIEAVYPLKFKVDSAIPNRTSKVLSRVQNCPVQKKPVPVYL